MYSQNKSIQEGMKVLRETLDALQLPHLQVERFDHVVKKKAVPILYFKQAALHNPQPQFIDAAFKHNMQPEQSAFVTLQSILHLSLKANASNNCVRLFENEGYLFFKLGSLSQLNEAASRQRG